MVKAAELAAEVKLTGAKEATKEIENLTKSFGFLGGAASGVLSVLEAGMKFVQNGAMRGIQVAREIDRVSFKTGIGVESFQRLDKAFKQHGGNIGSLISSYQRLQQRVAQWKYMGGISEAEGRAFGFLGVDPSKYKNTWDLMKAITDSLLKIKDVGKRNMLAGILGIDQDFLRVVEKGKYYVNDLLNLTKDEKETFNQWEENINALNEDFDKLGTKLGVMFTRGFGLPLTTWVLDVEHSLSNAVAHAETLSEVLDNLGGSGNDRNWWGIIADGFDTGVAMLYNTITGKSDEENHRDIMNRIEMRKQLQNMRSGGKSLLPSQGNVRSVVEQELRAGGLSGYGVYGALGNIMQESSFNPTASNGSHWGLVQWDKNRQAELLRFANGADVSNPRVQARFLMHEIRQRGLLDKLNNARSPEEAARIFERGIEVSGSFDKNTGKYGNVQNLPERMRYSRQFSNGMMDRYAGVANSVMTSNDTTKNVAINNSANVVINADNADASLLDNTLDRVIERQFNVASLNFERK